MLTKDLGMTEEDLEPAGVRLVRLETDAIFLSQGRMKSLSSWFDQMIETRKVKEKGFGLNGELGGRVNTMMVMDLLL